MNSILKYVIINRLKVGIKVWCENNYYGEQCTTFCDASSSNYQCDQKTGEKICNKGKSCSGFYIYMYKCIISMA